MQLPHLQTIETSPILEGIKRLFTSSTSVVNPLGLSSTILDLLEKDLGRLDEAGKGLGAQAFRYVVDDEGADILLRLRGVEKAATALRLHTTRSWNNKYGNSSERRAFFAKRTDGDGPILYRLGEVFAAAAKSSQSIQRLFPHLPDRLIWLECLLIESTEQNQNFYGNRQTESPVISAHDFESALKAAGEAPDCWIRAVMFHEASYGYGYFNQTYLARVSDLGASMKRHAGTIIEALKHPKAQHRVHVIGLIDRYKPALEGQLLCTLEKNWVSSAKTVREAVDRILLHESALHDRLVRNLKGRIVEGTNTERLHAVTALGRLAPKDATDFLPARLEKEKGARIRTEIQRVLGTSINVSKTEDKESPSNYEDGLVAPPPVTFPIEPPLRPDLENLLTQHIDHQQKAAAERTKWFDRCDTKWRFNRSRSLAQQIFSRQIHTIVDRLTEGGDITGKKRVLDVLKTESTLLLTQELEAFIDQADFSLPSLLRFAWMIGMVDGRSGHAMWRGRYAHDQFLLWVRRFTTRSENPVSLIDLAAASNTAGVNPEWIERIYLFRDWGSQPNPLHAKSDQIWPFFLDRTEYLSVCLGIKSDSKNPIESYYVNDTKRTAYSVLQTFPRPPKIFVSHLWKQALGTSKFERPLAQACLANFPNRKAPIILALQDGRKDVRTSAADWSAKLELTEAVTPLKQALKKEKHDTPKAAMMEALEKLGVDIDQFLNRKKLLAEAERGMAKTVPKDLIWFPFDQLPEVHWEKTRQQVPPVVLRWFVVQTCKVKNPEPGPLLRRYFALMRPVETAPFGKFVFDAWLHQDTVPKYNHAEASKLADQQTAQLKQYAAQSPQFYPDFDEQSARKQALNNLLKECLGSANSSKGILAISACCCGAEVVPVVQRFMKQWYGQRLHQCKALIQMLNWIDHPLAIQLLLSIGTRFRTKGIQNEAAKYVDLIAERKNWTRDELADRTVPNAGFERDGHQLIDYGNRKFTARLAADFSVQMQNADGKIIKALPNANQSEDTAEIKALKKRFSANKKELNQVLKMQRERLYEAMCVERVWRFEDWELFLNQHPIVGRYCQQLVWLAGDEKTGDRQSFRPLPDLALTDVADETVALKPDTPVRIAHQALLTETERKAWNTHLDDYEVSPLFTQFGNPIYTPDDNALNDDGIKKFEGHLINSFKLRWRANKLGYVRGSAEDGGFFTTYLKNFPSLKLQAILEFTGNSLPEENRTVALVQLYFIPQREDQKDE